MRIKNTNSASQGLQIGAVTTGSKDYELWGWENGYLRFGTNNSERIRIDSSGNVGINTTSPSEKLQVAGNISANAIYGTAISASTQFVSTVATGTAPMQVASTTKVTNLNVDYLDGYDSTNFLRAYSDGSAVNANTLGDTFLLIGGSTAAWVNRGPSGHNGGAILHTTTHPGGYYSDLWFDTSNNNVYSRSVNAGTIGGWAKLWAENNDGSGSGLDSDTID